MGFTIYTQDPKGPGHFVSGLVESEEMAAHWADRYPTDIIIEE